MEIFVVDDDPGVRESLQTHLQNEGYRVQIFDGPPSALEALAEQTPALIVSDISMPQMDGFAFYREYRARYADRRIPFVFLSSLGDETHMVQGLELGVEDYLVKPVVPAVLCAKVRNLLQRSSLAGASRCAGNLSQLSFINLLKFCETQGLTGELEIEAENLSCRIPFHAGHMSWEESDQNDALLGRLYDLEQGAFTIVSRPVDFGGLGLGGDSPSTSTAPVSAPGEEAKPMGLLSGVQLNKQLVQLQTEYTSYPEPALITVATLNGRTVLKRSSKPQPGANREALERAIREQHAAIEQEVRDKLEEFVRSKKASSVSPRERFDQLFEEGFDRYTRKDYRGALEIWQQAQEIDPSNKTVETNLKIVRQKLEEAGA